MRKSSRHGAPKVVRVGECRLPVRIYPQNGQERGAIFHMYVYKDKATGDEHVALVRNTRNGREVPTRIHSSCITSESFGATNCDCLTQLRFAMDMIDRLDFGVIVWLKQEGMGNGLAAKTKQINLSVSEGLDRVSAFIKAGYPGDARDYGAAADILKDLGVSSVKVITNNPKKMKQLSAHGIEVTGRISSSPAKTGPEAKRMKLSN